VQVVLYGSRLSPFVQKVIRGVQRKGLRWEVHVPKKRDDMRRWNPQTGKMPAADLDGERLYDSTLILRRLDALVPDPPLLSRDPVTAAQQRQLEDWADESLFYAIMAFRWSPKNGPATAALVMDEIGIHGLLRRFVGRAMCKATRSLVVAQGMGRLPEPLLAQELGKRLDDLVTLLDGRPFFHGDEPSVADLAVFAQLGYADIDCSPETHQAVRERPALVAYMDRVDQATRA
jgi:glutathione S-transferase